MVNRALLEVADSIVYYTEVDVGKEFACDICDLFVLCVELNCVLVVFGLSLTHFHEVDSDAVVGKSLSVDVTDGFADLEELLVLLNSCQVLSKVVIEDTSRVIGSAFIS